MIAKISYPEMRKLIDESNLNGIVPFQIGFVSFDEKRNTGGKKKFIKRAAKAKEDNSIPKHRDSVSECVGNSKNPFHFENQTVNIIDLDDPGKHIIKVHYRLVFEFNHKFVTY